MWSSQICIIICYQQVQKASIISNFKSLHSQFHIFALFGIKWHALSQSECRKYCITCIFPWEILHFWVLASCTLVMLLMAIFISLDTSHLFLVCFSSYPAMACPGSARDVWKCQKGTVTTAAQRHASITMRSELFQLAHVNMFHYTCMFKRTHSLFMVSAFTTHRYCYLCYSSHSRTHWYSKTNVFQMCFAILPLKVHSYHWQLQCFVPKDWIIRLFTKVAER